MDWYESEQPGLGGEFGHAVEAMLSIIQHNPEQYQRISDKLRRAGIAAIFLQHRLQWFEDHVVIAGCVHNRSHPRRWIGRK
jgi:hypothetical protein